MASPSGGARRLFGRASALAVAMLTSIPGTKANTAARNETAKRQTRQANTARQFLLFPRWYREHYRPRFLTGPRRTPRYASPRAGGVMAPQSTDHAEAAKLRAVAKRRDRQERNLRLLDSGGHSTGTGNDLRPYIARANDNLWRYGIPFPYTYHPTTQEAA